MVETHEIRYFLAVCQEQNFTRAAQRCRVAQPSLTRAIKKLEEKYGGPLFDRTRGRIALTDLGRRVYSHLACAMAEIERAQAQATHFKRARMTTLRLGIATAIQPALFEPAIDKLLRSSTGIRVDVREGSGEWIVNSLLTDEIDVGVSASRDYPDLVEAAAIHEQPFGIALAVNHPLARSTEIAVADLKAEKIIAIAGCDGLEHLLVEAEAVGVNFNTVVTTNSEAWALELVANGLGVAVIPVKPIYSERVVLRSLAGPVTRVLSLITMRGRRRMGTAEQFIRLARRMAVRPHAEALAP